MVVFTRPIFPLNIVAVPRRWVVMMPILVDCHGFNIGVLQTIATKVPSVAYQKWFQ